ncbi:glycosyltransferase [Helicobacter cappadocius]|uniref:Glycosyltransferase n=1 Tax=Helicobacter cappadocius TaxID=3063998 RepID=A0AA90T5K3_9HELI|nr:MULTISPECIES: glycosyltransferase [unclassified Helicobacter]MDO7253600.1 glycosyltransferase [Helicobacter sp. faydin-H75]MDP2539528.1 glycosyltransferase [Helicobacter sp. faydin-H76]
MIETKNNTSVEFWLLGKADNSNPSSIPLSQIKKWQSEGAITYLGVSDDVREHIANASCIILPSSYREGIPLSLLEAMSMEKPIITTDVPGCKETIFEKNLQEDLSIGKNGILCLPKNVQSLQNAINFFLQLPTESKLKMGIEGRKIAQEIFDVKNIVKFYETKVQSLCPKSSIVFISNTSFGMYHFRLEVLKTLKNLGFAIHILAPQDESSAKLLQEGFHYHCIDIDSKSLNPYKDIKTFFQIKKILKQLKPQMSFCYTIKPVIYGSFIARMLKIPNIAMITGLGYVFVQGGWKKKILKFLVCKMYQIALSKTSEIWFLNSDDEREFLNNNITTSEKTTILKSEGINTEHFSPRPCDSSKKIVFLLIARMLWDKGVGEFVQVAKNIKTPSCSNAPQQNSQHTSLR